MLPPTAQPQSAHDHQHPTHGPHGHHHHGPLNLNHAFFVGMVLNIGFVAVAINPP